MGYLIYENNTRNSDHESNNFPLNFYFKKNNYVRKLKMNVLEKVSDVILRLIRNFLDQM